MTRVQTEIEEEEIDIPKENLEEERHILYGKQLDSSVIQNYYKSQLPSKTYQEHFKLDNTLPYVSTYMLYVLWYIFYCIIFKYFCVIYILRKNFLTYSFYLFVDTNLHTFINILFETCRGTKNTFTWTENGTCVWIFNSNHWKSVRPEYLFDI